jgi:hypothetical protein
MASHNRTTASEIGKKVVDIPTVPTIGTATAGGESASITFTASTKGGTASTYTALSNPGSVTGSGASSPVTVSGLTAGTAYTFTVRGNNVTGSSEYSSATSPVTPFDNNSYVSIATSTLSSSQASIEFTSIPQTYTHLQIRGIGRTSRTNYSVDQFYLQLNGSTSNDYASHILGSDGSTAFAYTGSLPDSVIYTGQIATNLASSSIFGAVIIDILDYTNTNKYTTTRALAGVDPNSATGTVYGAVNFASGLYNLTTAISSIKIFGQIGTLQQYSSFALYGIKGA